MTQATTNEEGTTTDITAHHHYIDHHPQFLTLTHTKNTGIIMGKDRTKDRKKAQSSSSSRYVSFLILIFPTHQ